MKKLNKNFGRKVNTVETMISTYARCECTAETYCFCNTVSDYAGYYVKPNTANIYYAPIN